MKNSNEDWKRYLPSGGFGVHLFSEFEKRAKAAATEVYRVKTSQDAADVILTIAKEVGARKAVSVASPLLEEQLLANTLKSAGIELFTDQASIAAHASAADIGISGMEFGVAESGSILQDAWSIESRLVSSLPPIHIALIDSSLIVPGITEAFEIVSKAFDRGYVTFITGPSRTADIEVVLTIGVHGPVRLVIIAIDASPEKGGNG
jgi:L-lactate dehydrogenase complex protein LldG